MDIEIPEIDVIIVGAGSAGLMSAISLAPLRVLLISDSLPELGQTASHWSKGGIAAPISKEDSAEKHIEDTIKASGGTADRDVVSFYVNSAPKLIDDLIGLGVNFDRDKQGKIYLGREGSHSLHRVLTSKRDSFGLELMRALIDNLHNSNHITHLVGAKVVSLLKSGNKVSGVKIKCRDGEHDINANYTILATGGIGALYARTTNPSGSKAYGLAMAVEAGADFSDLEYVQFHPTAIDCNQTPLPMISEALRGAGAKITNSSGERFMEKIHELAELAPRDVVCRAVEDQVNSNEKVYLDIRELIDKYPSAVKACKKAGINPEIDLIPITTAAHYHMGGIHINYKTCKTSVDGLWACGEITCTGMHGANRLASNSLLEALLTGKLCAENILSLSSKVGEGCSGSFSQIKLIPSSAVSRPEEEKIKNIMTSNVGVYRNNRGLSKAIDVLNQMGKVANSREIFLQALSAKLIATSAMKKEKSVGAHFRTDFS